MCNLSDFGLVSPEVTYKTIQKLQRLLSSYEEGRVIIAAAREAQLDYWKNFGLNKQIQQEEQKKAAAASLSNQNFDLCSLPKQKDDLKSQAFIKEEKVMKKSTKGKDEKLWTAPTSTSLSRKGVSKTVNEDPSNGRKKVSIQNGKLSIGSVNQNLVENGINKRKYSHIRGMYFKINLIAIN